ncbi:thioredoxin-disulfide reductase [Acidaminococcus fermentans]|uniref:thioredoxin-disulfide reductase n=1 Tax=Acidaminococcus fermentans TaxID=905 RepID=UPI00241F02B0|nr:thioredoxin-disulfide reductase [Acidaminococcus fermentans]MCF0139674.1 thioredoxin-disulfide reductase [Acidaminococcus fermentans]MCI7194400.1 thioredoxin-disulfide reductase [Acidaminococcus fermentans]MDY4147347.1 thioredoxin-disulfide reductase [Acidaminococcus fermentans]MEE0339496.1 thioredoxin-disulfide reductase [Acidaminococcus fermentans]
MSKVYDILIIGGGPAGYTAALYGARSGFATAVLEKLSPGGQMATTSDVENYPGFPGVVDGFELGERMQEGAEKAGAETFFAEVSKVDLLADPKVVETSEGTFLGRTVILATGAHPRKLGIPQEEALVNRGVAYCATCDGNFYKDKVVVVNGGGNTAVGDALYLAKLASKVYLVHRRDTLRATPIYLQRLKDAGVEIIWNSVVSGLQADKKLTGVELTDVKTGEKRVLPADGLFVAIGQLPESSLAAGQVATDKAGYILAGEDTKTSVPGVFAVGDVRTKAVRQIITAAADGAVAIHYAEEYLNEK